MSTESSLECSENGVAGESVRDRLHSPVPNSIACEAVWRTCEQPWPPAWPDIAHTKLKQLPVPRLCF
jgi:hypothetical protein